MDPEDIRILVCVIGNFLLFGLVIFGAIILVKKLERKAKGTVWAREIDRGTGVPGLPSKENFVIRVKTAMAWGDDTMVSGILVQGRQPQKETKFRITRTGREGTIADVTNLRETFGAAVRAGASVSIMGSGSTLQSKVAFRTCDVPANEIQQGDEIVSC